MANASFTSKLSATVGNVTATNAISSKSQTIQSTLGHPADFEMTAGTSRTLVDLSGVGIDLTKEYGLRLGNEDAAHFVTVEAQKDAGTYVTIAKMLPGEPFGPIRAPGQTAGYPKFHVTANTAACLVEVTACELGDPTL
jgi:hypothetical protein